MPIINSILKPILLTAIFKMLLILVSLLGCSVVFLVCFFVFVFCIRAFMCLCVCVCVCGYVCGLFLLCYFKYIYI